MADSVKENKPGFFDGVKSEWNKIIWPDKEQMTRQTFAVIAVSVVLGVVIALLDTGLQYCVNLLSL